MRCPRTNLYEFVRCCGVEDSPMTPPAPVSVTSRLSCRVFNPHFGTSEHSAFGQIRISDKFGLGLNFDVRHAFFIIFYLNQMRNIFYFLGKTCSHHNIYHHHIHKKFNFQNILNLSPQRKEIPAKLIFACSLERR